MLRKYYHKNLIGVLEKILVCGIHYSPNAFKVWENQSMWRAPQLTELDKLKFFMSLVKCHVFSSSNLILSFEIKIL